MSKHIVGRKTETFLTGHQRNYGEPWTVTRHVVTTELHATKGWRQVSHQRSVSKVAKLPSVADWRAAASTTFERTMPRKDPAPDYSGMYDPMRHPWQRKKKTWDMIRDHYNTAMFEEEPRLVSGSELRQHYASEKSMVGA
jgi:hypothetical protein